MNGNITLIQTGKTVSYVCAGSNSISSQLPMADLASSACKTNDIRIKRISLNRTKDNEVNFTTSHYEISARNDIKGSSGITDTKDESNHLTLMILLSFSHDVTPEQVTICPVGDCVRNK